MAYASDTTDANGDAILRLPPTSSTNNINITPPTNSGYALSTTTYPASNNDLTDRWGSDLASILYEHARGTTTLPGSDTAPDWEAGQRHADTLLAAGHWPHLRIPTLTHYGTPTTPGALTTCENRRTT